MFLCIHYKNYFLDANNLFDFTANELALFERRYEEGYDLEDSRYNDWLKQHHLLNQKPLKVQYLQHQTAFIHASLEVPSIPTKHCGRVLTSSKRIEQTEKEKQDPKTITSTYVCMYMYINYVEPLLNALHV